MRIKKHSNLVIFPSTEIVESLSGSDIDTPSVLPTLLADITKVSLLFFK